MSFTFRPKHKLLPIFLGCILLTTPVLRAVTLEMGREGEVLQHQIETPNLQPNGKGELPWNPSSTAIPISKIEPGVLLPVISAIPELFNRFQDLIGTRTSSLASDPSAVSPLKDLLGVNETFVHTGPGTSEKTAKRDGTATVEAFLPTYRPATVEVRIINADNTEELFFGASLLAWMRPDDKAKALVKFKGVEQPGSMFQDSSSSDWSPNPQTYTFDLKAGQRLILSITGNPLATSYLRVISNAF